MSRLVWSVEEGGYEKVAAPFLNGGLLYTASYSSKTIRDFFNDNDGDDNYDEDDDDDDYDDDNVDDGDDDSDDDDDDGDDDD